MRKLKSGCCLVFVVVSIMQKACCQKLINFDIINQDGGTASTESLIANLTSPVRYEVQFSNLSDTEMHTLRPTFLCNVYRMLRIKYPLFWDRMFDFWVSFGGLEG